MGDRYDFNQVAAALHKGVPPECFLCVWRWKHAVSWTAFPQLEIMMFTAGVVLVIDLEEPCGGCMKMPAMDDNSMPIIQPGIVMKRWKGWEMIGTGNNFAKTLYVDLFVFVSLRVIWNNRYVLSTSIIYQSFLRVHGSTALMKLVQVEQDGNFKEVEQRSY